MTLLVCDKCTTRFSVGEHRCPHCSSESAHFLHEEDVMPHATVHGGPTNTPGEPDPVDENGELVVADSAEPVVEESATEEADAEYGSYKVDELRAELEARGLDTDGLKADLVARLEENDAA